MEEEGAGGSVNRPGILARLFRRPSKATAPESPQQKVIPESPWLKKQEAELAPKAARTAYTKTVNDGFPEEGSVMAPGGRPNESPVQSAAREGNLPVNELDSLEVQERRAKQAEEKLAREQQNRTDSLRTRLGNPPE